MADLVHTTVKFDVTGGGFGEIKPVPFNDGFEFDEESVFIHIKANVECKLNNAEYNNGEGVKDVTGEIISGGGIVVPNNGFTHQTLKLHFTANDLNKTYAIVPTLNNCVCYPTPHEGQITAVVGSMPYIYFKPIGDFDETVAKLDGEEIELTQEGDYYYCEMNDGGYESQRVHELNVAFKTSAAQHTITATLHFADGTEGTMEYSVEDGGEIEIDGEPYMKKTDALKKSVVDGKDVTYEFLSNDYKWKFANVHEDHNVELWLFTPTAKQQGLAMQLAGAFAAVGNNQLNVYGTAIMLGDKNKMRELAVIVNSMYKHLGDLLLNDTMN